MAHSNKGISRRATIAGLAARGTLAAAPMPAVQSVLSALFPKAASSNDDPWLEGLEEDPGAKTKVSWPSASTNPDYCFLPAPKEKPEGATFSFTADTLRLLMKKASFLDNGEVSSSDKFIFVLRGCILDGDGESATGDVLALKAVMPDHVNYRCLVGVAQHGSKTLWAYKASSVANATALYAQARDKLGHNIANYLPTGRYDYAVKTHGGYPGKGEYFAAALRMGDKKTKAQVVTLRPRRLVGGRTAVDGSGRWSLGRPSDNIHPANTPKLKPWEKFSSEGCTVILSDPPYLPDGRKAGLVARGLWTRFAEVAEVSIQTFDKPMTGVTFTGREAMLAASRSEVAPVTFRPGSRSPGVRQLGILLAAYGEARGWQNTIPMAAPDDAEDALAQLRVFVNDWLATKGQPSAKDSDLFGPRMILAWLAFQSDYRNAFTNDLGWRTLTPAVTQASLKFADSLPGAAQAARAKTNLTFSQVFTAS